MADDKKKTEEVVAEIISKTVPVEHRFRDLLSELSYDVVAGAKLAEAKQKLHTFCEELLPEDREILYRQATAISQRVRDITTALTGETPVLLAKLQPKEN